MWTWHDIMEESKRQDEIMDEAEIWADMLLEEKIEELKKKIKEEVREEVKKEVELEAYNSSESSYTPSSSSYSIPNKLLQLRKRRKPDFSLSSLPYFFSFVPVAALH